MYFFVFSSQKPLFWSNSPNLRGAAPAFGDLEPFFKSFGLRIEVWTYIRTFHTIPRLLRPNIAIFGTKSQICNFDPPKCLENTEKVEEIEFLRSMDISTTLPHQIWRGVGKKTFQDDWKAVGWVRSVARCAYLFARGEGNHTPIMNVPVILAHCASSKTAISYMQNISTRREITSCEKNSRARESISKQQLRQR